MKIPKNNTTGYRGVAYETKAKKFRAYINIAGDRLKLGYYLTAEGAYKARKEVEEMFSYSNDGFRVIKYIESKFQGKISNAQALCCLFNSILEYDFGESFIVYSYHYILNNYEKSNFKGVNAFEKTNLKNDEIFMRWMNGYSVSFISKQFDNKKHDISKHIRKCIETLKSNT